MEESPNMLRPRVKGVLKPQDEAPSRGNSLSQLWLTDWLTWDQLITDCLLLKTLHLTGCWIQPLFCSQSDWLQTGGSPLTDSCWPRPSGGRPSDQEADEPITANVYNVCRGSANHSELMTSWFSQWSLVSEINSRVIQRPKCLITVSYGTV